MDLKSHWLIAVGGVMGTAGVGVSALSAHVIAGADLEIAGSFLLFHAAAVLALAALGRFAVTAAALAASTLLFSGDLILWSLANTHLFPMAAPAGGIGMILSWTALSIGALIGREG